ncbi:O-methyltransferase [Poritiphilus flavus]|uniref:O-methyltransferase n=1 Tax=Poritiphilus flavus TaxID=2697053 RepID=A0A6L9EI18_9FLAO|nr:O-methyltransferase [Poritiphilus flavus]NAS14437.1 O-methyltransferase [Poritiphilus flavus]
MNDPIFQNVDDYLADLFRLEDDVLKSTEESIRENGMPEHSVSANQGQFLYLLAKLCKAQRIIEVGTLGGYSTIWLGRALDGKGKLTSIEIDPNFAEVARKNISNAGLEQTVDIITGDALEILGELSNNGHETIDLFFMDADKPNYVAYFEWALKHSRKGSLIVADNVIREGQVLDENSRDEKVIGVRNYNKMLSENLQVTTSILQQVGIKDYDGIAISMVQ